MNKKKMVMFGVLFFWTICACGQLGWGQDRKPPFTKAEILRLLKPMPGVRYEQGDLAGEIAARGVAFPMDEKTIAELRKAGARTFLIEAIQQAAQEAKDAKDATPPQPPEAAPPPALDRPALKREEEAPLPPAPPAKLTLLEQAAQHAAEFVEELPNFIVTQFVTRSVRTPERKDWQAQDQLEVELTYRAEKGEQFKLLRLNGKPTQMSYKELGGATSTGEFGSMLAALFAPQSRADFKEVRRESFRGHPAVVFDFKVKKAFSSNQITDKPSGRTITAGYQGSVWIETETGRVLRIEQSADDIQRGFPITLAESAVEYDWVTIAGGRSLLPVYAEVILGSDPDRYYSRNVIELRNYHIFETDLKIVPEKDPSK